MGTQRVLRVALIGGAQYDALYARLPIFEERSGYRVEVVAQLPHPELNAFVAEAFRDGRRPELDLISTHIKYAPSQAEFLLPLDGYVTGEEVARFVPAAIRAAVVQGRLVQLPRMVDARLLFYRTDLLEGVGLEPPRTWEELGEQARRLTQAPGHYGYVLPGRLSGLFGTFFELVSMAGGRLFDEVGAPVFEREGVEWSLRFLHELYEGGAVPSEVTEWHFDEVSACFREGRAAFVADWPAFFALYNDPDSAVRGKFGVMRYPLGPAGRRATYAGMHSFAIPVTARDVHASLALLSFLLDEESQWLEAQRGAFPARSSVLERLQGTLVPGSLEARRLELLTETVREDMLMFPHLARYPQIEDELWPLVQGAMVGTMECEEAAVRLRERAEEMV